MRTHRRNNRLSPLHSTGPGLLQNTLENALQQLNQPGSTSCWVNGALFFFFFSVHHFLFHLILCVCLPLWASPVMVPSPGGFPSWSRHFQSMPRTTRAPGTMYFITWERNRRRWRRRFASASFTALPAGQRGSQIKISHLTNLTVT